jgi:hypothetical protein
VSGTAQETNVAPSPTDLSKPKVSIRNRVAEHHPETAFWLASGLSTRAAFALAQARILTLQDLSGRTKGDLQKVASLGGRSFRVLEQLLGHPIPERRADPSEKYWTDKGFTRVAAQSLCRAGLHTLEDLARADRETLEELPRLAKRGLKRCDELLGHRVPAKRDYWIERGLPPRIAGFLVKAGIHTLDDLGHLTREDFLSRSLLSEASLEQCEQLLGRRLPSPPGDWVRRGCRTSLAVKLVRAGILTVDDLRPKSASDLSRAGLQEREIKLCKKLAKQCTTPEGGV